MPADALLEPADVIRVKPQGFGPRALDSALGGLAQVGGSADLTSTLGRLARQLGFDFFSYLAARPGDEPQVLTSYPDDWYRRYLALHYHRVDPVVTAGRGQRLPFFWGGPAFTRRLGGPPRTLFEEARDFGIVHGVTFPTFGPSRDWGLLSLSIEGGASRLESLLAESYWLLQVLAPQVQATVLERCLPPLGKIALTERERSCLAWTLQGKTAWEVSRILGLSKATADFHLQKAARKLGAANKLHAAVRALELGLL